MSLLQMFPQPSVTAVSAREGAVTPHFSPWLLRLAYPLGCHVLLPTYFSTIQVTGREHLPSQGPVILAPTHRSRWDALLVPYAAGWHVTGRHLRFMVTADEVQGFQGSLIRRFGGFPIDPNGPAIASLRLGIEILRRRETLVLFPEGGIFRDQGVHSLKPGLARLALQVECNQPNLGTQIVPMSLRYSEPFPKWGCDVRIDIGQALPVAHYCGESSKEAARRLTADLEVALRHLVGCAMT